MTATPLLEEMSGSASGAMIGQLAEVSTTPAQRAELELHPAHRPQRRLAIYPAAAGFDLVDELDHLSARAIEPNIFFNPRFLAPAMPRLEDREVRLAVIRDGTEEKSRLRLLAPYSIEKSMAPLGVPVMRIWSHHFGPLGTPLADSDDPAGVMEDFFTMLARPHLNLPQIMVLPDIHIDGPFSQMLQGLAEARGLPLTVTGTVERAFLESGADADAYLRRALRKHHFNEFRRLKRRLSERGELEYRIAREPADIRLELENFLALEAAGWKGRKGTAMAVDRLQSAFAREAVSGLAERDLCRIHTFRLDGKPIASLVVLVEAGIAYTWKTAFDESWSAYSPGTLLMIELTRAHLQDPAIKTTDSCAAPDHPVVDRLWTERRSISTIVIGLTPQARDAVDKTVQHLRFRRETQNFAHRMRERLRRLRA